MNYYKLGDTYSCKNVAGIDFQYLKFSKLDRKSMTFLYFLILDYGSVISFAV
jgi:hypothetical protein